jgi:hypothetical protein
MESNAGDLAVTLRRRRMVVVTALVLIAVALTAGVGVSRIISEQPTVTYPPSQGEAYVRRFLTSVTPQTLLLLWDSGWSYTQRGAGQNQETAGGEESG